MTGADGARARVIDAVVDADEAVVAAAAELDSGGVIGLATDTVYGLAARMTDAAAIGEIFALKGRPEERRMAVLVAEVAQAERIVDMTPMARDLAASFWPGPLTIVAPRRVSTPDGVGDERSIGVRCPDEPVVRALVTRVGALAATSANLHGQPTPTRACEVARLFPSLPLVLDGGERGGGASTVVSVLDGEVEVVRSGPINEEQIRGAVS